MVDQQVHRENFVQCWYFANTSKTYRKLTKIHTEKTVTESTDNVCKSPCHQISMLMVVIDWNGIINVRL